MLTNQSIGYMDAPVPKDLDLKEAIDKLRKEKNAIMRAIMEKAGMESKARTFLFSVPVDEVAGLDTSSR